ncbi:rCG28977 [Rattus norvegicus]|uniref:RCG28977 n=1 Tax=Rattus norvegicus TaxID=10116 RepID=A6HV58_RAT|nr:rCG28977 [Rattus norvegicus]
MCGAGNGAGTSSTCGSYYNANNREFSEVPYSAWDFNDNKCDREVNNYQDAHEVRDCRLSGLLDLALDKDYIRTKVADYMNHLIDIGVAGFRLDASKHMWPGDIKAVLDKLHNLNTKWFSQGSKPFIFQEVIDNGGEAVKGSEYFGNGLDRIQVWCKTWHSYPQVEWRADVLFKELGRRLGSCAF